MFEKSQMSPELQVRCRSDGKSQTEPVSLNLKRHSLKVGVNWNSNYCLNLVSNTACREAVEDFPPDREQSYSCAEAHEQLCGNRWHEKPGEHLCCQSFVISQEENKSNAVFGKAWL